MGSDRRARHVADLAQEGRLADAAFTFSTFAYPDVDFEPYDRRLADMARRVSGTGYLAVRRVVAIEDGLGGNVDDYYDPLNSYVHEVLDRRKGIPISLSVVWMEVARRAGRDVEGVGLPGHFVVYVDGQLVDPFHGGEAIGFDEAAGLVAQTLGGPPRLDRSWLEPVSDTAIIVRMLRNLNQAYRRRGELQQWEWIAACMGALGAELPM